MENRSTYMTVAPEAYDGFGTETVRMLPWKQKTGQQYREVSILDEHADWQLMRYASGMVDAITPEKFNELVEYELLVAVP